MKQEKIKQISGKIRVETGLHIGAGSDTIEIGGMDNPIIKNPVNDEPYIPGSSLKGKMRSLMEWYRGKVLVNEGNPCNCGECEICTVFGCGIGNKDSRERAQKRGPTRLIVRDALLSEESRQKFLEKNVPLVEEKHENTINRITAAANPRPLERVVPGTQFDLSISYRVLDRDDGGSQDEENFNNVVLTAMALLEQDYLGGGGSRGNGKIKFLQLRDESGSDITLPEV